MQRYRGPLVFETSYSKKVHYDMGNLCLLAQADGCCSISRLALVGRATEVFVPESFYMVPTLNGVSAPADSVKEVEMLGRKQMVRFYIDDISIECETFLDDTSDIIYLSFNLLSEEVQDITLQLDFGMLLGGLEYAEVQVQEVSNGYLLKTSDECFVHVASDEPIRIREIQDKGVHLSVSLTAPPCELYTLSLAFALHEISLDGITQAQENAITYGKWLGSCAPKTLPSQYYREFVSCLNCGISSFKKTETFEGFFAGVNYMSPARTYYRDSFFTAIAVLPYRPDLVLKQLRILATGIGNDGKCPSAVKENGEQFWPDHLDSPSYFVLLLSAYVESTGDKDLLHVEVAGQTMLAHAQRIVDSLIQTADENGLLYRQPGNRHDWADNVFREGYVTYIEALFCQSVKSLGNFLLPESLEKGNWYLQKAEEIASAIEKHLYIADKGYYANYLSKDYLEDHLSIDTVLLAFWDIIKPERAKRLLENMEKLLETRNNSAQPYGDWGTMCVWPPYSKPSHLVEKSSYAYVYHNGSDWPFWSCVYAIAKIRHNMNGVYPATRWFDVGLEQGSFTPVEYYNPLTGRGGLMQAWSAMGTLALDAIAEDLNRQKRQKTGENDENI